MPASSTFAAAAPWLRATLFAAAYFACAALAHFFSPAGGAFVNFWLPSGLFVATLLRNATRHWPLFVVAAFPANIGFDLWHGQMAHISFLFCCSNCLEALAGAWLVRRFVAQRPDPSRVRELLGFMGFSAVLGTALGATLGAAVVTSQSEGSAYGPMWLLWWSSDAVGVLLLAPLILAFGSGDRRPPHWKLTARHAEAAVFAIALCLGSWYVFRADWHRDVALKYVVFSFSIWAALRFGVWGTAWTNLIVAAIAAWCTVQGQSDIATAGLSPGSVTFALQFYLAVVAVSGMILTAVSLERRRANRDRSITAELLRLTNESQTTRELVHAAVTFFRQQSGCEAVGVRLREGDVYPYYEVHGFPPEFVLLENRLCARDAAGQLVRDSLGNPAIECMCGNVICGRFDPAKPFFTARGSFWSNCTTELLASTTEADRLARTRNRCNGEGYESVALLPLRVGEDRFGLLQLNDHRKGMFTAETIALWERLAGYLAVALSKFRADEALRESELRLRRIVEHTAAGYFFLDREGRFQDVNEAWLRMHGFASREEIVGRHYSVTQVAEDLADAGRIVDALMDGRPIPTGEFSRRCADGSIACHTFTAHPVLRGGSVIGAEGFLIDVTGRKQAEEAVRKTQAALVEAQRIAQVGSWEYDVVADEVVWSAEMYRIFGRDPASEEPPSWIEHGKSIHPDDRERTDAAVRTTMTEGIPCSFSFRIVDVDGGIRWGWTIARIARDSEGQIVKLYGTVQDITERKRTEEALQESETRLRSLFENMLNGFAYCRMIFEQDRPQDFVYLAVNGAFERLTGLKDVVGRKVSEVIPGIRESDAGLLEVYGRVARTGLPERLETYVEALRMWFSISVYGTGEDRFVAIFDVITDRKLAEAALRASEAAHRSLVRAMPDVVMRFDRDGRHLFVSDNVETAVGIPAQQFIGRTHRDLGFPRHLCDFWEDAIRWVFDGGAPHETEFSVPGKRGPMTFNWRLVPEFDAQGSVQSVLSISRDITAHRDAERNYQTLFREMLDGFALHEIVCDAQGAPVDYRFLAVNPAFERMTGLTAEAAVGKTVRDILPDIEPHWIEAYGRVALTGEPACFENYAAGLGRHFQVTAFRPTSNQFACIFVDITERRRAETALLESQTELQAIYDNAPVMMCVLNANREVQYVNRALAAFVGKSQTELNRGRACGILGCINALDDPRGCGFGPQCVQCPLRLALLDTMETGRSHTGVEYRAVLLLDHKPREVVLLGSTARTRSAGQDMLLLCLADITDRKRAEEERRHLEAQVLHAQKLESLGVLAGGIAHDFNNLLSAIISNADLAMQQLPPDSPAGPHVERSLRAAARAADLTRQMLTYSGRGQLLIRRVDLNGLVEENAHLLHASIPKEAELRLGLYDGLPLVEADPGQLQQIVMNLITNAAEALGGRPGVVLLRTGVARCGEAALATSRVEEKPPAGEFVFLEVSDSGCGMDAETQRRLFDPFFSTKFAGRGLGLSAVLGIVRAHRGAIFVQSEVGSGTTIRVLFPATAPGPVAAEEEPRAAPPAPSSFSGTVLMADDDEMARAACQAVLTTFGFQVLVAADGEEAVRVFREHADAVCCVVLDLTMPKMDGLAASRAMRQIKPDLKVVLVSGYDESEAVRQFGAGQLDGFVQKPYRLHVLAAAIQRALNAD